MTTNDEVKDYYNQLQFLYDWGYSLGTNGIHYGFWDKNTKTHAESILNTNDFVIKCLDVKEDDKILDAGCGIGGTSLFIANKTGAKVHGITLSEVQLKKAKKLALNSKNPGLLQFSIQDYAKTKFKENTFSKVFGIESINYADQKIDFLREAYRVLKKGGKITVVDFFRAKPNLSEKEKKTYETWLHAWATPCLDTLGEFRASLKKVGFKNIKYYNKFNEIKKSRDRIYSLGKWGYPVSKLLFTLGIFSKRVHDNTIGCLCQKEVLADTNNTATYGAFAAEK